MAAKFCPSVGLDRPGTTLNGVVERLTGLDIRPAGVWGRGKRPSRGFSWPPGQAPAEGAARCKGNTQHGPPVLAADGQGPPAPGATTLWWVVSCLLYCAPRQRTRCFALAAAIDALAPSKALASPGAASARFSWSEKSVTKPVDDRNSQAGLTGDRPVCLPCPPAGLASLDGPHLAESGWGARSGAKAAPFGLIAGHHHAAGWA